MTATYIVELRTKPGKRDELKTLFDALMTDLGPALKELGSLGSALYEVLDDPDMLIEIAEWESAEKRDAVMQDPRTGEALAPVLELLAGPFKATPLRPA